MSNNHTAKTITAMKKQAYMAPQAEKIEIVVPMIMAGSIQGGTNDDPATGDPEEATQTEGANAWIEGV